MPNRPLRRCAKPGCCMLTASGYCPEHKPKKERTTSEAWHYLYTSPRFRWQDRRQAQLLAEPFCRECAKQGVRTPAMDVDHVEPHRGDIKKFMTGELQSLCHRCHSRKTLAENAAEMNEGKAKKAW